MQARSRSTSGAGHHTVIGTGELWLFYFGIGGLVDEDGMDAYTHSTLSLP